MVQFLTNCTNLSIAQLRGKNLAISLSAFICFLATSIIFFLLVLYRTFKSLLQRLFLYLTAVILVHLGFISLDIQLQFNLQYGGFLCKVQGFLRSWTVTITYILITIITIHLIQLVSQKMIWTKKTKLRNTCNNFFKRKSADVVLLGLALLLPLTYLWIPFYHDTYGIYATSCWIQKIHQNCSKSIGSLDQIVCTGILRASMIIVIVTIFVLLVIFCRTSARFKQIQSQQMRRKIKQTLLLMVFFLASFIVEASGLAMYIYSSVTGKDISSYTLWVVYDIAMPMSQLVIPVGLLVYLYSFKKQSFKKALKEWRECCKIDLWSCRSNNKGTRDNCLLNNTDKNDDSYTTNTPSDTRNPSLPSGTYFEVEYTGEFTNITDAKNLVKEYGSISTGKTQKLLTSSYPNDDVAVVNGEHNISTCEGSCSGIYSDTAQAHVKRETRANTCEKLPTLASLDHSRRKHTTARRFARSFSTSTRRPLGSNKQDKKSKEVEMEKSSKMEMSGRTLTCTSTHFSIEYTGEFTTI